MSGGITQLVAIGAQDTFLTENPEVSFFRSVFKRHTNFSMSTTRNTFNGVVKANGMSTVRVPNTGDLLSHAYIIAIDGDTNTTAVLGDSDWFALIKDVELLIGGQVIDKQSGEFSKYLAKDLFAKNLSTSDLGSHGTNFYPLRFSFFEELTSALPLVALQYHDVVFRFNWGSLPASPTNLKLYFYLDFIHLDTQEREFFSQNSHQMIMTQIQKQVPSGGKQQELMFNHPVKCIAMANTATDNSLTLFSNASQVKFQANGVDLDDYKFVVPNFTSIQSFYHAPYSSGNKTDFFLKSFCNDTSKLQPTGTLNFSRLDSFRIFSTENINSNIYAVNYNVLKIENGMGGLLFSD
jgi:hypothetical protein